MASREWNSLPPQIRSTIEERQAAMPIRLSRLANDFGVAVKAATLAPGISGELRPHEDGFIIRVNRHDPPRRQRFTVAHELAHYLLHRDQIGDGIEDDALYRSELSDAREAEANRLAADILMPLALVRDAKVRFEQLDDRAITMIADEFGVSEAAMKIRLGL
jgi:Zn-dependent peptidase ImmA (M78 family)